MKCRNCKKNLSHNWLDLGTSPPSNNYLSKSEISNAELMLPLKVFVCDSCWLSQTEDFIGSEELFRDDYAYFSSTSSSWLMHAKKYSEMIISKLNLNSRSNVLEIASNDGYLLKNFTQKKIPCIGIEPTRNTAEESKKFGIKVIEEFFGSNLAENLVSNGYAADLVIGNNVYAHVPDIRDFTKGIYKILAECGTVTLEFPHLLKLLKLNQFDTVYHEHFSYLSLTAVINIFESENMKIYDVEEIPTHGGSLRIYGCKKDSNFLTSKNVKKVVNDEKNFGLTDINIYRDFQNEINIITNKFYNFILKQKENGAKIAAYGAAAKGNTLLNYIGIKTDLIDYVCDAALSKQGKFLPGSHIPILHPDHLKIDKPNLIIIFPWNLSNEIANQLNFVKKWDAKFITAIPELKIF
tara:strand:+ start:162 stop:1385 length:1224 start_codon:yes stop_codon:yes gene_type:complete